MTRLAATLGLAVAIAVVIAIVLATSSPSAPGTGANHGQTPDTTTVQRRDLVQTDTESGTLSYANPHTVYNRVTGTITWLPAVGRVIRPGQALYRVNGAPVILMDGSTPAYRDLKSSDTDGPDILQLNRNLVKLGFNPDGIVVDDVWQPATTAGVELFQASLGETETGSLTLGQIVFLPGPQVVSTVDANGGSLGVRFACRQRHARIREPHDAPHRRRTRLRSTASRGRAPQARRRIATLTALLKALTARLKAATAQLRAAQAGSQVHGNSGGSPRRQLWRLRQLRARRLWRLGQLRGRRLRQLRRLAAGAAPPRSSRRAPRNWSSPSIWTRPSRARPRWASRSR